MLSSRSFADLKGAFFVNAVDSYLYEDSLDARYPADDALRRLGGNFSFYRGGARMRYFQRETKTALGRIDFNDQSSCGHR